MFNENPELAELGTEKQYSEYLSTIFPESKTNDIAYHGSPEYFEEFDKDKLGSYTGAASAREGIFFGGSKDVSKSYLDKRGQTLDVQKLLKLNPDVTVQESDIIGKYYLYEDVEGVEIPSVATVYKDGFVEIENEFSKDETSYVKDYDFSKFLSPKEYKQKEIKYAEREVELFKKIVVKQPYRKEELDKAIKNLELAKSKPLYPEINQLTNIIDQSLSEKIKSKIKFRDAYRKRKEHLKSTYDTGAGAYIDKDRSITDEFFEDMFIKPYLLNIKNPSITSDEGKKYREKTYYERLVNAKKEGKDGVLIKDTYDSKHQTKPEDVLVIFDPEQSHLLGSKKDIQSFREFVNNQTKTQTTQQAKQQASVTKEDMKISSVVDMAETSTKMKFGSSATGRFAIASKLMSVFTQNNISLNDSIKVKIDNKEIELKKFKNNSSDDMAILLQAALDMGNDPILSSTGINGFTIDGAITFLLLGLDLEQTMKIINDSTIQSYAQEFENINSIYNTRENISFKKFIRNLRINNEASFGRKKPVFYKPEELINLYGQNMAQFIEASDVANDLSSLIDYIQLDKQLPNNSIKAFNLNDTIKKFNNYSFNVNNIQQNDLLYNDREKKLKLLRNILDKNFLTSNKTLQNKINNVFGFGGALQANNPNQFKNQFNEDLIHLISQNQLSKRRTNVFDFMYNTSKKLENIKNSSLDLAELPKEVTTQVVKLYEIKEQFGSISNEFLEQKKKVERIIKNVDSKIKIYEEFLENKKDAEKYKGNKFIENLNFFTIEKTGEKLVSLSNNFKASEEIKNDIIKGFKDLQNLNPDLAQDIIDYQLYRYGVNNKIGSFIDILPSNINMQVSKDLTRYKKDDKFITNNMDNIINNIALKNIEMIKETNSLFKVQQDMRKNTMFQTQKEFTQFSTQEINKISIEEINDTKNNC